MVVPNKAVYQFWLKLLDARWNIVILDRPFRAIKDLKSHQNISFTHYNLIIKIFRFRVILVLLCEVTYKRGGRVRESALRGSLRHSGTTGLKSLIEDPLLQPVNDPAAVHSAYLCSLTCTNSLFLQAMAGGTHSNHNNLKMNVAGREKKNVY